MEKDGTIRAETVIEAGDGWFDGHFPGQPLLPAVAQLALAWEAVRPLMPAGTRLAGFRRVKFKEMVRPGEPLSISAAGSGASGRGFSFTLRCSGRIACTGSLVLKGGKGRSGAT
jgi:3-hydroxymyristoyl/3-hydroxydecanoyl-(acyl carrier protein) dehydratase